MYQYLFNTGIGMYSLINLIAAALATAYCFSTIKRKKQILSNCSLSLISWSEKTNKYRKIFNSTILGLVEIYIIYYICYALPPIRPFGEMFEMGANYFVVLLVPVFLAPLCILLRINMLKQLDLIAPMYPLGLFIGKIACFCCGCCHGIECSFGLYNHKTEAIEFPVQLLEAVIGFFIFLFIIKYKKNAKEGTVFPMYMIAYSGTRFFSEFLRGEENVFWIFKTYHFFCLAGLVISIIEFLIIKKYATSIGLFFNKALDYIIILLRKITLVLGLRKERSREIVHHKKRKK